MTLFHYFPCINNQGINWNGSKICNYGLTCFKHDDDNSQCRYDPQIGYHCAGNQSNGLLNTIISTSTMAMVTIDQNKLKTTSILTSKILNNVKRCKQKV
jgi:hypothetical protein